MHNRINAASSKASSQRRHCMKIITVFFLGVLVTTLSSCASNTHRANNFNLEVVKQPNQRWIIKRLIVFPRNDITRISGRLTAHTRIGLPKGHIDIAAYSPSGDLIVETTANYTPSILTRRKKRKGGLRFAAEFSEKLPTDSVIKVAFHRNVLQQKKKPIHRDTIAQ